jgi:hypothetical protein
MRLALTHFLFAGASDARPPDALGTTVDEPARRFFVPGWLPCGECGRCRRGWLAACPRGQALVPPGSQSQTVELPERFLCAVDDPTGVAALDDGEAVAAGVVAELQEAGARAGLGSGDVAVWIGEDARSTLGARLSAARGCTSFQLRSTDVGAYPGVTSLSPADGGEAWSSALAAAAAAAPGGFQERRLFVARAEASLVASALALVVPGTTLSFLDGSGAATVRPSELSSCRMIVAAGRGYHPDLVPEALAALRRDRTLTQDLVVEGALPAARDDARLTLVRA